MSLLNDFGKSLTDGFGNFLRGYTNVAQKIGRGVSTAGLLTDVDNPEYQDGIQLTDIRKTYEKSKDISPGQAFLAASDLPSPLTAIRGAAQILGDKTPTMFKKDFNIYDEQQRKQAFETEIVGKLASGSVDAVVTWFADPLVIGGKAIKVARVGAKVGKLDIPGLIEQRLPKTAEEISKAVTKGGWDRFLDEVVRPDMDASALLKNKTVRRSSNPELLASVFGNITDKEVGKTVLKAVLGDDASVKLLEKSANNSDVAAIIKRQQRKIDKLRPNRDINAEILNSPDELNAHLGEFKGVLKKDELFAQALELAKQNVFSYSGGATRFGATEGLRAAFGRSAAQQRGLGWISDDFQLTPFHGIMRVMTWGGRQRPSGWITTKGINSTGSSDELIAFMDQVKPWTDKPGQELKRRFINKYVAAKTDAERAQIAELIERKALTDIVIAKGFNQTLDARTKSKIMREFTDVPADKLNNLGDVIYQETVKRRNSTLTMAREKGFFFDEEGRKVFVPFVSSQLPDALPMIDIRLFQKIADEHGNLIRKGYAYTTDALNSAYTLFDSFWRPATLMRLGYPQRNVGEGSLRAMAYMNGFMNYARPVEGVSNFTRNRLASVKNKLDMVKADKGLVVSKSGPGVPRAIGTWQELIDVQKGEIRLFQADKRVILAERKEAVKKLNSVTQKAAKQRYNDNIKAIDNRLQLIESSVAKAEQNIDNYVKSAERKGIKGNRYRLGQKAVVHNGIEFNGAFQGNIGEYAMDASSAQRKTSLELSNPMAIGEEFSRKNYVTMGVSRIAPKDINGNWNENYFSAIADSARVYRNDEAARLLMRSVNPESIVASIVRVANRGRLDNNIKFIDKNVNIGKLREDLINSGVNWKDAEEVRVHLVKLALYMKQAFPDATLRRKLSEKTVSTAEIRKVLENRTDLIPVNGGLLAEESQKRFMTSYKQTVNKIFKYIGALPEDTLVRHPFYNAVYNRAVSQQVDQAIARGMIKSQGDFNKVADMFVANAHRVAMKETNNTLYTIQRYSNFASVFAFFSPFIQAQLNTVRTWGRIGFENPQIVGRALQIWNAPEKAGFEETDPITGDTYITFQASRILPKWFEEVVGKDAVMRFPKRGFNLVLAGDPWWNPGAGPVLQVAVSQILKNNPDIDYAISEKFGVPVPAKQLFDLVLQNGPSTEPGSWDLIFPATAKRVIAGTRGPASKEYANSLTDLYAVEMQRYRDGKRETEPTFEEMNKRTSAFYLLRFLTNATLPVIPQYRSEYEFYIQEWRKEQQTGTDAQGRSAQERFYERYPEYFVLALSGTKNISGSDASPESIRRLKKNSELVSDVAGYSPELVQLISNDGVERNFDKASYVWQLTTDVIPGSNDKYRKKLSPVDAIKRQDVVSGWIEFNKFMDGFDAELEKAGITSLSSNAGQPYSEIKKGFIAELRANNKNWANDFDVYEMGAWKNNIKAIDAIISDEKFIKENDSTAWALMRDYMASRDDLIAELKNRESMGQSKSITAVSNKALLEGWEQYVSELKKQDTQFSSWYNRFLEQDKLESVD